MQVVPKHCLWLEICIKHFAWITVIEIDLLLEGMIIPLLFPEECSKSDFGCFVHPSRWMGIVTRMISRNPYFKLSVSMLKLIIQPGLR